MRKEKEMTDTQALTAKGEGDLSPENNSINKGAGKLPCVSESDGSSLLVERRDEESFRKTLKTILSMAISPDTVCQAVKSTSLGEKITYQEAILIAQVLKASNGDTQAAVFVRDSSGNKLKEANGDSSEARTFETFNADI
ncbi:MAG: hypothetical protein J6B29_00770 [Clostridia bacterium]|nr:hypothetical protein [Clostridia bacterium]